MGACQHGRLCSNTEAYGTATTYDQSKIIDEALTRRQTVAASGDQVAGGALFTALPVPRRPPWAESDSAERVHEQEEEAFVNWRRGVAELEEAERRLREEQGRLAVSASVATPFERNLEVWRQLWRTLERSDSVLLIVDCRWPDFYANPDAIAYARALGKRVVVVLNKADYLRPQQRREWHRYWETKGLACVFFSARKEQAEIDAAARKARDADGDEERGAAAASSDNDDDAADNDDEKAPPRSTEEASASPRDEEDEDEDESAKTRLLTRQELLALGEAEARKSRSDRGITSLVDAEGVERRHCVGMIGYPNVGKSSCLNVLRNTSALEHGVGVRVAVSATPGKTKHLQTMIVHEDLELCDCPGLVFPALVKHGSAELGCSGVVPLSKLRDGVGAAALIASRVPRFTYDVLYGTQLMTTRSALNGEPLSANELLDEFCRARHCVCPGSGSPDHLAAAKVLMKDYVDGTLLFCHAPPDCADVGAYHAASRETAAAASLKLKLDSALQTAKRDPATYSREAALVRAAQAQGFLADAALEFAPGRNLKDAPLPPPPQDKTAVRQISKKSNKWHAKKNRKNRDPDPYGAGPDSNAIPL